jgi:xanthine dehydrogenase YagS FAD-binding subunit
MRSFEFHRSLTLRDALAQHAGRAADAFVAGGTTLLDLAKLDVMRPDRVIDLNRLPLNQIERTDDGGLRIGALVRNSDLAWHADVQREYPVLAEAILAGASAQIRNMATTAGNLMQRTRCPYFRDNLSPCNKRDPGSGCAALDGYNRMHALLGGSAACIATHPSDMCVALAVLDATVVIQNAAGERRVALADFHLLPGDTPHLEHALQPGEIITTLVLGPPLASARSRYVKLRDRESFEFALASAAVVVQFDGHRMREARVALGGVATKPWRATAAEKILRGAEVTREVFRSAAAAAVRDAKPRRHNAFKVALAQQAIVRALEEATASAPPS